MKIRPAMSFEEIAEVEKMSVGAVTMCLSRALKKLREQKLILAAWGVSAGIGPQQKGNYRMNAKSVDDARKGWPEIALDAPENRSKELRC
jgi:hypothetical protein